MKRKVLSLFGSAGVGGTELRSLQLACRLREKFQMAALFMGQPGPIQDAYRREGIPFWTVPFLRLDTALRIIHQFKPDVIHLYGLEVNIIMRPLLYLAGHRFLVGYIAGLSNTGEAPGWLRILPDRLTYRLLKTYIVNSARVAEQMVGFGFSRDRLTVINNGVTLPPMPSHPRPHQPPIIISVGNLRVVKGFADLLTALEILQKRGVEFEARILGDGPERGRLADLSSRLGLTGRVRFYGAVENSKLYEHLAEADIFTLLSLSEGISGAAMEAMANGLPVVCTEVGGMPELITPGVDGYLVSPNNPAQAADRLGELIKHSDLRNTLGASARLKIESHFNLDRVIQDYERLYLSETSSQPVSSSKACINSV